MSRLLWVPALLLLSACDGGRKPAAPSPDAPLDACTVLTQEDVEQVLETRATGGQPLVANRDTGPEWSCGYEVRNPGERFPAQVDVTVSRPGGKAGLTARSLFDSHRRGAEEQKNGRDVPDLGDAALWHGPEGVKSLVVLKGAHLLRIQISLLRKDTFPLCVALARRALPRLP